MKKEPIDWITINGVHVPIFEGETKEEAASRFIQEKQSVKIGDKEVEVHKSDNPLLDDSLTEEELRKEMQDKFIDKDSYLYSDEYKALQDDLKEAEQNKADMEARREELRKIIKEGSTVDPEDVKTLGRDLAEALAEKTPEALAAEKELYQLNEDMSMVEDIVASKRNKLVTEGTNAEELRQKWVSSEWTMKEATKDSYEGFELDTHTPKYQDATENGETVLMEMSPREYLERCAYDIFWDRYGHTSTYEGQLRAALSDAKYTQGLAKMMQSGTDMYLPVLDYKDKEQEGRHRAVAAMMLGLDRIPVLVRLPRSRR